MIAFYLLTGLNFKLYYNFLKQTGQNERDKYGKHCTLRCQRLTFLKAQLDFRGWKGQGGAIASGAAIAQAIRRVFIVCSEARANLLFN